MVYNSWKQIARVWEYVLYNCLLLCSQFDYISLCPQALSALHSLSYSPKALKNEWLQLDPRSLCTNPWVQCTNFFPESSFKMGIPKAFFLIAFNVLSVSSAGFYLIRSIFRHLFNLHLKVLKGTEYSRVSVLGYKLFKS